MAIFDDDDDDVNKLIWSFSKQSWKLLHNKDTKQKMKLKTEQAKRMRGIRNNKNKIDGKNILHAKKYKGLLFLGAFTAAPMTLTVHILSTCLV